MERTDQLRDVFRWPNFFGSKVQSTQGNKPIVNHNERARSITDLPSDESTQTGIMKQSCSRYFLHPTIAEAIQFSNFMKSSLLQILSVCRGSVNACLVSASTTPTAVATAAAVVLLPLVLHKILSDTAENSTSDGSQEAMPGLFAQEVTTEAAADGTEKATITFSHRGSVGIEVWRIGVG